MEMKMCSVQWKKVLLLIIYYLYYYMYKDYE